MKVDLNDSPPRILIPDEVVLTRRVLEEDEHGDRILFDSLTPHEKEMLLTTAEAYAAGDKKPLRTLWERDFVRRPVSPQEFISSTYYTGSIGPKIYDKWREDLIRVLDPRNEITEWILCVTGDTTIPLLDGTSTTIKELADKYENSNATFGVYSVDSAKNITVGQAHHPRRTGQSQPVFKVILDDGSIIRTNADHELVLRNGQKRRVKDLRPGDSLMPFYTDLSKRGIVGYETIYDPGRDGWVYTHQAVAGWKYGSLEIRGGRNVVHHKGFNKRNNNPSNLLRTTHDRHFKYHGVHARKIVAQHREMYVEMGRRLFRDPRSTEARLEWVRSPRNRQLIAARLREWNNTHRTTAIAQERGRKGCHIFWHGPGSEARVKKQTALLRSLGHHPAALAGGQLGAEIKRRKDVTVQKIIELLEKGLRQTDLLKELNCTYKVCDRVLRAGGLSWRTVLTQHSIHGFYAEKRHAAKNHKVVAVVPDGVEDVYCMTVDRHHNFAVCTRHPDGSFTRNGVFSGNTGAKGIGKNTVAQIAQMYKLYFLSCLKRPYEFFNLMDTTLIVFMLFSLTREKAEEAVLYNFKAMIDGSPYFIDTFPHKKRAGMSIKFGGGKEDIQEIVFPKGIRVITGAQIHHSMSLSVFSGILDEVNFRGKKTMKEAEDPNSAIKLYEEISTRIATRFMGRGGHTPGILCTVSSKKATTDFIDRHIERMAGNRHVYVSDYRLWDVKPDKQYSGKRFFCMIGATPTTCRKIKRGTEEETIFQEAYTRATAERGKPSDAALPPNIISIPEEYESFFDLGVVDALQSLAGISTAEHHLLFEDPMMLRRGVDATRVHPFDDTTLYIGVKSGGEIKNHFLIDAVTTWDGLTRRPKWYPAGTRFIHVDLAKGRRDSVGIAMGCVSRILKAQRLDKGNIILLPRPIVFIDFVLQLRAPEGDEVFFGEIRSFFSWLRHTCGYRLGMISFDQWNSVDSLQLLQKQGFKTRSVSVDRTDKPYTMLKETIAESRFLCYYYQPLFIELQNLIRNREDESIDHPQYTPEGYLGSKDCADSVAGVVYNCTEALTLVKKMPGVRSAHSPEEMGMPAPGPIYHEPMAPQDAWPVTGQQDPMTPVVTRIG